MIVETVLNIVKGLIAGMIASGIGYAKKEDVPTWELKKMLQTVFLGGFTMAIVNGTGMPISKLAVLIADWLAIPVVTPLMVEFAIMTGLVIVVDHLVKLITRRTDVKILWTKFKEFIAKYVKRA